MILHFILILFCALRIFAQAQERVALVSMAPYVKMVEDLTSREVEVKVLVPAGFSAHTYEPTPKQILEAAKASIWFTVGETFEVRAKKALQAEDPKLVIVDLQEGLHLLCDHECHDHSGADTHIWMSPKMMQEQVLHMAKSLEKVFPDLASTIEKNKKPLIDKLDALDQEIHKLLDSHKGGVVFVSHPAYGYFCEEYGIVQESIEFEGKDPTPKQLYHLVETAKKDHVKTIFTQKQYSTRAAELVAKEVGAKVVMLNPYSEDYFISLEEIAKNFSEAL